MNHFFFFFLSFWSHPSFTDNNHWTFSSSKVPPTKRRRFWPGEPQNNQSKVQRGEPKELPRKTFHEKNLFSPITTRRGCDPPSFSFSSTQISSLSPITSCSHSFSFILHIASFFKFTPLFSVPISFLLSFLPIRFSFFWKSTSSSFSSLEISFFNSRFSSSFSSSSFFSLSSLFFWFRRSITLWFLFGYYQLFGWFISRENRDFFYWFWTIFWYWSGFSLFSPLLSSPSL